MYTYIHVCMYIYIYIYICVYVYIYIYMYIYIHVCIYLYIYIYIYIHWYTYICIYNTRLHIHVFIHTGIYVSHAQRPTSYMHDRRMRHATHTGWRGYVRCLKLQDSVRKRATNDRALLRKIIWKDKAPYHMRLRHPVCMKHGTHINRTRHSCECVISTAQRGKDPYFNLHVLSHVWGVAYSKQKPGLLYEQTGNKGLFSEYTGVFPEYIWPFSECTGLFSDPHVKRPAYYLNIL